MKVIMAPLAAIGGVILGGVFNEVTATFQYISYRWVLTIVLY